MRNLSGSRGIGLARIGRRRHAREDVALAVAPGRGFESYLGAIPRYRGAVYFTIKVTVVEWTRPPPVPVIVIV